MLRRPEVFYKHLTPIDITRPETLSKDAIKQLEVSLKYEGYIKKQLLQIEKFKDLEKRELSTDIDYSAIENLRLEARQKLDEIKPISIGQASRISGVSPSDISVLLIYLEQIRRKRNV